MKKNLEKPLAEICRPLNLNDFAGQKKLVSPGTFLWNLLENHKLTSIVFWGPPGTGKTTLARILCKEANIEFTELSAVVSGVGDIKKIAMNTQRVHGLFIDEIHRFSKTQQDALLPWVEKGKLILLGATTENPVFSLTSALKSRLRVIKFEKPTDDEVRAYLKKSLEILEGYSGCEIDFKEVLDSIVNSSGGDLRKAILLLEDCYTVSNENEGKITITMNDFKKISEMVVGNYELKKSDHFDCASAFQKSIRGSDVNAALYYMARMLEGGEPPEFIMRRLLVCSCEDVGMADPMALVITQNCFNAIREVGMPEGRIILANAVIYNATALKSNAVYTACDNAIDTVRKVPETLIPEYLKSIPDKRSEEKYIYPHVRGSKKISYLPRVLSKEVFYNPSSQPEVDRLKKLEQWQRHHHTSTDLNNLRERVQQWILENSENLENVHTSDISDSLGIPRDIVYRILLDLENEGKIKIHTKATIEILIS
ncbi:MAG: replication-associated recombination protein A [Deltaproteobacteria bacterium]|nr:replication-associated recombination protein A [Deltaproteobacteria bacterium]